MKTKKKTALLGRIYLIICLIVGDCEKKSVNKILL